MEHKELQELTHEEWPGFMVAFLILFPLGCLYLALILLMSM